jgi:hypothetical protein
MSASYNYHWSIFQAWNDWKAARFADSDVCSEYELKRRARYLGIPVAQLRWVSSYRPDPTDLLERRMGLLSLDPDEIAHMEPDIVGKLRHHCVKCTDRDQCALDLADKSADPGWQYWRDYCPNAATLTMLSALQAVEELTDRAVTTDSL